MLIINIPNLDTILKVQLEEDTIVSEVLEIIQEKISSGTLKIKNNINVNKNIKYWTCYSLTQNKVLNHQEILRNQQTEKLYIYFDFKQNFSEIYVSNQQDQYQNTFNSELSTDRQTFKQSELQYQNNKIIIFLDGIQQLIEMDSGTQVKELFEYLAKEKNIDLQKIKNWSCFSETQNRKLKLDDKIGNNPNEVFQIKTVQLQHAQSAKSFDFKLENFQDNILKTQYIQESPELLFCSKTITLTIEVHDNIYVRKLTAMFLIDCQVEKIAKDVLRFCSLTIDQVSVDLFINGQQFNNPDKRALTLQEANLNRDAKIVARIRWIN
ncbi:unnamed protein product [Paramecium pentaurelia]|uniref:Uncharacterized protein n=1 Tax=Paramecium pentaurelia TaxID=43138 RepID=A0A8S1VEJ2_9CILI|nr:unnamed protein product [Paramecium pentaurelia]